MACQNATGERCETCADAGNCAHAPVRLDADLEEVWRLWCMSRTQLRVSFGGAIGLDYNAVWLVSSAINVEMDEWILKMLQALENDLLEEQAANQKKERKEQCRSPQS